MTTYQRLKSERMAERELRARGVYKPYVCSEPDRIVIESYPLTAYITDGGCDPEMGPARNIKITDCSLARIGMDSTLTTQRTFEVAGPSALSIAAEYLVAFHEKSYARAKEQDRAAEMAARARTA